MKNYGLPPKQGLYDPRFEHDACGMGFVVDIKGKKSHSIVTEALKVLENLSHRGATGSEENTGDGAGVLTQIPHDFFKKECMSVGINLPDLGKYGVGMIFLPQDERLRSKYEKCIENIVSEEGQKVIGWRDVPIDSSFIGDSAKSCMPFFRQVFINRSIDVIDDMEFERKLYIIRKRSENLCEENFYVASFSHRTIVYKGMLTAEQLEHFYIDLSDEEFSSALALVHSRFSTNTFPSWERAHPNRYLVHNGEINTLRGNVNWMRAREAVYETDVFGDDISRIYPIVDESGSDSSMFDNSLEFLSLSGRSLPHAVMMMIPEPWAKHENMDEDKRAFYEYHSCLMEPWDGPAAMAFTDGLQVGAILDRNGLRPSRYYLTKDDKVILASEVGVLEVDPENVAYKGRLQPGRMLLVDTLQGRIISDEELKNTISTQHSYKEWLEENMIRLEELVEPQYDIPTDHSSILTRQRAFGYNFEDLKIMIEPMAKDGVESLGAMGIDSPLAVLSEKPRLLYDYFKQLFAQVTNPPIDALREELVTSAIQLIGSENNILKTIPQNCSVIEVVKPILSNGELSKIRHIDKPGFRAETIPVLFDVSKGGDGLAEALDIVFEKSKVAIKDGANIIILSDRGVNEENAPIPALLAVAAVHHYLIREGLRTKVSLVVETGEAKEVHHFCALIGYGATVINPYLAYETIEDMIREGMLRDISYEKAIGNYIKAGVKGIIKVLSKMGISTIQSYQGAQIFEAVGINREVIDKYFNGTASRIEGIGLKEIAEEVKIRFNKAYKARRSDSKTLELGGQYQWRKNGEYHMYNPESIHKLQIACREGDYNLFKEYSQLMNGTTQKLSTIRGLLEFKADSSKAISIDEVESVEEICKRFKTGAMSYGSISKEAHESLAIAMNRIGGKSNTGEGGEDSARFISDANGDSRCSAIKQVASGRFGVTINYLSNAKEIQIKMAQGAKPGEGGQLPGRKVYPWVAKARNSTPGVGLISPPPHHDIYSIEDLAELIHDLKNANRDARINVKLVSEVGVGTIAAGVAKGKADVVLISGYDGGTGAAPRTSINNTGLPWELGLAETHQTLLLNNLRDRIVVETDGKLLTGRDVVIAALLGAEEYGFATAPLVVLGCVMMRVCNLDTCPVGVATQNPELRKKFKGKPEYVVNFMKYIAQEMREIMAELGFRTINEMIGRTDKLEVNKAVDHWKASGIDLSPILFQPRVSDEVGSYCTREQEHGIEASLDMRELIKLCEPAIERGEKVRAELRIKNINRVVGTVVGNEIAKRYGEDGLPEDTITLNFKGSAGQSFGAFTPKGMTFVLEGDANDYVGKGLSGSKVIVYPPKSSTFIPEENIIIGNVAFYGAISGEAYIRGMAGERFCVRNSGIKAVVEAVGDHGCEYMTGGRVVVLGSTGRNFAAGMSGGIAYVLDNDGDFEEKCNKEMVQVERIVKQEEADEVKSMIENHLRYTESNLAKKVLDSWDEMLPKFARVIPVDYKRMMMEIDKAMESGLSGEDALMAAFESNNKDISRVGGN